MKNLSLLFLIGMLCVNVGCVPDSDLLEETTNTEVEIRIENISDFKFEKVGVVIDQPMTEHGTLESGSKSAYVTYASAYSYAYLECFINDELFVIQPIDYTGEELLPAGKYTYEIDASSTIIEKYGRLSLTLRED